MLGEGHKNIIKNIQWVFRQFQNNRFSFPAKW